MPDRCIDFFVLDRAAMAAAVDVALVVVAVVVVVDAAARVDNGVGGGLPSVHMMLCVCVADARKQSFH